MEQGRMALSVRERDRLKVLREVEPGHLKQVEAARQLRLSVRQVRRVRRRVVMEGDRGLVHRLRGRRDGAESPLYLGGAAVTG
jgi:hypothetical protein